MIQTIPNKLKIETALEVLKEHLEEGTLSFCDIDDMIQQKAEILYDVDTVAGRIDHVMHVEHDLLKEWKA